MKKDKEAANDFLDAFNSLCDKHGLTFHVHPDGEVSIASWASGEELWEFDSTEEFVIPRQIPK